MLSKRQLAVNVTFAQRFNIGGKMVGMQFVSYLKPIYAYCLYGGINFRRIQHCLRRMAFSINLAVARPCVCHFFVFLLEVLSHNL